PNTRPPWSAYCWRRRGVVFSWLFSLHSQELMTMSNFFISLRLPQSDVAGCGDPGEKPPMPLYQVTCLVELDVSTNSVVSMPILASMHASGSQPPVTMAIFGMDSSAFVTFAGNFNTPLETGVFVHWATFGRMNFLRHFPTWMTSGMFDPTGTSFSLKLP